MIVFGQCLDFSFLVPCSSLGVKLCTINALSKHCGFIVSWLSALAIQYEQSLGFKF